MKQSGTAEGFRGLVRRLRTWAVLALLVGALTWASVPAARQLLAGSRLDYATALGACAAGIAWLAVLWFLTCVALALLARLPGVLGRAAHATARCVTPTLVRHLVEATLGATLAVAATTQAVQAAPATAPTPTTTAAAPTYAARVYGAGAAPVLELANGSAVGGSAVAPQLPPPDRPVTKPPSRHRKPNESGVVVVKRGDTLWDIAARHLPGDPTVAQIAAAWPQWYAANRAVVGADPDLIQPGQHLRAPAP